MKKTNVQKPFRGFLLPLLMMLFLGAFATNASAQSEEVIKEATNKLVIEKTTIETSLTDKYSQFPQVDPVIFDDDDWRQINHMLAIDHLLARLTQFNGVSLEDKVTLSSQQSYPGFYGQMVIMDEKHPKSAANPTYLEGYLRNVLDL